VRCVLFCLVLLIAGAKAQDKGEPISLHVKEVHRTQEGNEYGFENHFTAVVESKTVLYSIRCDETFTREKHGFTVRCAQLSAGKDYSARKFVDAINFWPPEAKGEGYLLSMYEIVSEKEK
jgi:hypothetical protein